MKFNALVLPSITQRDSIAAGIGAVAGAALVFPELVVPVLAGFVVWAGANALASVIDRVTAQVEGEDKFSKLADG